MTRTAKLLRHLVRPHVSRIEDALILKVLGLHRRNMLRTRSVTRLASHTGNQSINPQLQTADGAGSVTTKTIARLIRTDCSARSLGQGRWRSVLIAHGPIQGLSVFVKTYAALIKSAVVSKDIGLAGFPLAERVQNRFRESVRTVRYRVETLITFARDLVGVLATFESELRERAQHSAGGNRFHGLTHRGQVLACFIRMAFRASLRSNVFRVFLVWTPGGRRLNIATAHGRSLRSRS